MGARYTSRVIREICQFVKTTSKRVTSDPTFEIMVLGLPIVLNVTVHIINLAGGFFTVRKLNVFEKSTFYTP